MEMDTRHLNWFQTMLDVNHLPQWIVDRYKREMDLLKMLHVSEMRIQDVARIAADYQEFIAAKEEKAIKEYDVQPLKGDERFRPGDKLRVTFQQEERNATYIRKAGGSRFFCRLEGETRQRRLNDDQAIGMLVETGIVTDEHGVPITEDALV